MVNRAFTGSQKDYAAHAGVSKVAVTKWKHRGLLVFTDDGLVDFEASDRRRAENGDPSHVMRQAQRPAVGTGFAEAKARREHFQALNAEMDYKRAIGELVDRAAVEDALQEAARTIRRELDALPLLADELDAAARQGGVAAVRGKLRERLRLLQETAADKLDRLRLDRAAPDTDELDDQTDDADGHLAG